MLKSGNHQIPCIKYKNKEQKWILLITLIYQEPCLSPTNEAARVALTSLACRPLEPRLPPMQLAIRVALEVLAWVAGAALAVLALVAGHARNLGGAPAGAAVGACSPATWELARHGG